MTDRIGSFGPRAPFGVVVAVSATFLLVGACEGNDAKTAHVGTSSTATASVSASTTYTPYTAPATTPVSTRGGASQSPSATSRSARTAEQSATPESTKTAYDKGECLSGRISTSGSQEELISVRCSDPKANFKVLRVFPYTMAGSPCQNVSGADYTYSSYWTRNGVPTYGSTYCLSEIG
ncbi:LppU/SCO3897 family protein [Embleya sp. MST-111070]|uniref:LppU/SCO3897 family protein n=1 Tax=Embleya sp. MST-111070 TaxID=3398231 RepID=UPI003F732FA4